MQPSSKESTTSWAWLVVLLAAAALQANDPDPLVWVTAFASLALFHGVKLLPPSAQPSQSAARAACSLLPLLLLTHSLRELLLHGPGWRQVLRDPLLYEGVRESLGMVIGLLSLSPANTEALLATFALSMGAWVFAGLGCI